MDEPLGNDRWNSTTSALPPPPPPPPLQRRKPKRPAFAFVVVAAIAFRLSRDVLEVVARSSYGFVGVVALVLVGLALLLGWRLLVQQKARKNGGEELTPQMVAEQFQASGLSPPAFPEDGTFLGASVIVVSQRTKLIELNTEYDLFSSTGGKLGTVHQVGQSRAKYVARLLTAFDQFLTHHFEVRNPDGSLAMRLTRPRKLFLTRVQVHDGQGYLIGTIRQKNVFGRIRFDLLDAYGARVGGLHAEGIKAWDFQIFDPYDREVGLVVKNWEGWARTAWSRADRYVVRIHEPLPGALRPLAMAAAIATDLALKQDARGLG